MHMESPNSSIFGAIRQTLRGNKGDETTRNGLGQACPVFNVRALEIQPAGL